jgi:hypothetical protein
MLPVVIKYNRVDGPPMYQTPAVKWAKVIRAFTSPEYAVRFAIRRLSIGSLDFRLSLEALDRPQYAYGVKQAVYLASKLNYKKVSVIEFGVATGAGLLVLESYARQLGKKAGVEVEVYGFDTGSGLPEVSDYRDLGYVWKRGAYQMDVDGLKARLKSAKLILGNVSQTVPEFLRSDHAPIGFISFDLDYYSSTTAAFAIFQGADRTLLPRVLCYFDDVVSDGHQLHCDRVGEQLAIDEFNRNQHNGTVLAKMGLLDAHLMHPGLWTQQLWVYHRFAHHDYNKYIGE